MDDSKRSVQQFNAKLLTTSPGAGLSFEDDFSSSFSLRPPLEKNNDIQVTPTKSSSSPQRGSPAPGISTEKDSPPVAVQSKSNSAPVSDSELSTVSLDSPTLALASGISDSLPTSSSASSLLRSNTDAGQTKQGAGSLREYGWNDPPSSKYDSTPNRPMVSRATTSPATIDLQIQPFANHPDSHQAQGAPPPPPPSSGAGSNPYRIGTGVGGRKAAYSTTGIASFASQGQVNQPTMMSQPSMHPFQTTSYNQLGGVGFQSSGQQDMAPPPTSGFVPPSSSSSTSFSSPPLSSPSTTDSVDGGRLVLPIRYHWFYLRSQEKYWIPFSLVDSNRLESAGFNSQDPTQQVLVPTDGGRYDVTLHSRQRCAVYWEEPISQVRRCSWFYKGEGDRWYLPYEETTALKLEEEFQIGLNQSSWNRRVEVNGGEYVIMHSHSSIVHYSSTFSSSLEDEGLMQAHPVRHPMAVMRGFADIDKIESGEQVRVDHLVFVVHGIGAHHDLSFRSLVDCVDDFREVSQLMLKTHQFSNQGPRNGDGGGRVEFLPVHWHAKLHTSGVDECLEPLTLPSISRLREFTNSTLLDILYFTSPLFCQTIISEVASEMNRMYKLFRSRNPSYQGGVSVVGHSLGSIILFDLLYHQNKDSDSNVPATAAAAASSSNAAKDTAEITSTQGVLVVKESSEPPGEGGNDDETDGSRTIEDILAQLNLENLVATFQKEQIDFDSLLLCSNTDLKELGLAMGPRKKLNAFIKEQSAKQMLYLQAREERRAREAAEKLEQEKKEKEEVDAAMATTSTLLGVQIIKGLAGTGQAYVEYPQLLFQPQHLFALGSPIGLFLTVRGVEKLGPEFSLPTCPGIFNIFHPFDPVAYRIEPLVTDSAPSMAVLMPHHKGRKRFHLELYENLGNVGASIKQHLVDGMKNMWQQLNEFARSHTTGAQTIDEQQQQNQLEIMPETDLSTSLEAPEEVIPIGMMNQGRRIDHVLQEKPIEKLNEYLFALSSHLCYWHSEDTALFILKEAYQEPDPLLVS